MCIAQLNSRRMPTSRSAVLFLGTLLGQFNTRQQDKDNHALGTFQLPTRQTRNKSSSWTESSAYSPEFAWQSSSIHNSPLNRTSRILSSDISLHHHHHTCGRQTAPGRVTRVFRSREARSAAVMLNHSQSRASGRVGIRREMTGIRLKWPGRALL